MNNRIAAIAPHARIFFAWRGVEAVRWLRIESNAKFRRHDLFCEDRRCLARFRAT